MKYQLKVSLKTDDRYTGLYKNSNEITVFFNFKFRAVELPKNDQLTIEGTATQHFFYCMPSRKIY